MLQTKVSLESQSRIARLLKKSGLEYIQKVFDLIQKEASEQGWPLREIAIRTECDPENIKWEYVVVELLFDSTEEKAAAFLMALFPMIDKIEKPAETAKGNAYLEKIFYDFKTV